MTATATRPEDRIEHDSAKKEDERAQNALGLLRLAVIVLLIAGVTRLFSVGWNVLLVVAILTMIMFHELGHFVTARWAGMRVTDFFVGFGPTLWSVKRGDTRYGVKAFPIGGFVRVIGMHNLEEVDPEDEPYTYRAKTYWQRVRFAAAGSFTHFVLAIGLMVVLLAGFATEKSTTTLERVGAGRPAHAAGIRGGDTIVAIDGTRVTEWDQVREFITDAAGREVAIDVERGGEVLSTKVTPIDGRSPAEKAAGDPVRGIVGIETRTEMVKESPLAAVWKAPFEVKTITVDSAKALVGLFSADSAKSYGEQLTKSGPADPEDSQSRLLSPVGLFRMGDLIAENGVDFFFFMLVAINVFVAIFNLIPLPPFDGGHIAVATYEAVMSKVKGRRHMIDMNKLMPVAVTMVLALALLGVTALWLDIRHPLNLG